MGRNILKVIIFIYLIFIILYTNAFSSEISMGLAGINKIEIKNEYQVTTFAASARWFEYFMDNTYWFIQPGMIIVSYNNKGDTPAPDNFTGIQAFGGMRYYFEPFSSQIIPFVSGGVGIYSNYPTNFAYDIFNNPIIEKKDGLYYKGICGLRLILINWLFLDTEIELFEGALIGTTQTYGQKKQNMNGIFVKSIGTMENIVFSIGIKF